MTLCQILFELCATQKRTDEQTEELSLTVFKKSTSAKIAHQHEKYFAFCFICDNDLKYIFK
jgi:hypothetical protein